VAVLRGGRNGLGTPLSETGSRDLRVSAHFPKPAYYAREVLRALGADGCRGGWVAVYIDETDRTRVELFRTVTEIALHRTAHDSSGPYLFDVPIGLPERVSLRACDRAARAMLGARRDSVFPVPDRGLLLATYADVQAEVARRKLIEPTALGLSQQSFGIAKKIAELDTFLRADLSARNWVYEMHPEVSFRLLTCRELQPKKTVEGSAERMSALRGVFSDIDSGVQDVLRRTLRREVGLDDVLDGYVALWSALRVAAGRAHELGDGALDHFGLPTRIVA
jgi:predicted RNase H-like nuclease